MPAQTIATEGAGSRSGVVSKYELTWCDLCDIPIHADLVDWHRQHDATHIRLDENNRRVQERLRKAKKASE